MRNPFRYFNSSPEVIRVAVMLYVRYPELKRHVIALQRQHDAGTVLIEKARLGLSLVQDLGADGPPGIPNPIRIAVHNDKVTRMEAESARIEAGHVFLPADADWLGDFLDEMLVFPYGRHDDQVDSVSQFLHWAWQWPARRSTIGLIAPEFIIIND